MARNGTKSRLFRRGDRWWADLRSFGDVGGKREPLVPQGARSATTDRDVADALLGERIRELERARRERSLLGYSTTVTLRKYATRHLIEMKNSGQLTDKWIGENEHRLGRAVDFFGPDRPLATITTRDVQAWTNALREMDSPRGGKVSDGTVRHHLNALSKLFNRARSEGAVPSGTNPVGDMIDKPKAETGEAHFLDLHDAALLLEAARRFDPQPDGLAARLGESIPGEMMHAIIGTLLLTGARLSEALGLEVHDVSLDRQKVTVRPNQHRRLKTKNAHRTVPLQPQLAAILRDYLADAGDTDDAVAGQILPVGRLLFPSPRTGGMIRDIRKPLDKIAESAGWEAAEIRPHALRHTFCAHRLQCLDHGAAISPFTVSRELGHGGTSLVERVYGHLGSVRLRSEHLEYQVEDHQEVLRERLVALGWEVA
jgi:integrase